MLQRADYDCGQCDKDKECTCTYDVTLRSIRLAVFAVEKQNILHIPSVCF